MTSRERLKATLNHQQPDRPCVDFGATFVTGIHAAAVHRLRRAVLGDESWRVKVCEPYQMLGEIDAPLRGALGIDVIGIPGRKTLFGIETKDWKPFTLFDGTPVLVPGDFNTTVDPASGDLLIYPEGDTSAPPSGRMPKGGYFFDSIIRQPPIDDDKLRVEDNLEEFGPFSEADIAYYRRNREWLDQNPDAGRLLIIPGTAFGDIALVPAPFLKHPKGIRDIEEWYISTVARKDYVLELFDRQCAIAEKNLGTLIDIFGDSIDVALITGTDFGTQRGPFISREAYRELFLPFHRRINSAIHEKTSWKTFIHSCGSVYSLIPDFINAGFDILNPVQCSAAEMDASRLKAEFGKDLVFWGGGTDTQRTLPFGTPDQVYAEAMERLTIFNLGGGFVFNAIHNIQGPTPTKNMLALFRALKECTGDGRR